MNWRTVIQLTLVHVAVAITAVPINSTLNRIMIAEFHLSSALVGFLISLPYLLSPLQVIIGGWADRHPLWGRRRLPWIIVGGGMAALGGYTTPFAAHWLAEAVGAVTAPGYLAALLAFLVWGMGVNIASVSYLSLVSDLTRHNEAWRTRAISLMWTTMIVSIIVISTILTRLLEPYSTAALYRAFGWVSLLALIMLGLGSLGIEPAQTASPSATTERQRPLANLQLVFNQPAARRFFVYLVLILIGIYGQDVLLEPFGAQVLHMSVAETSGLARIWGVGVLIALICGVPLTQHWGKKGTANGGAWLATVGFLSIIVAGFVQHTNFFLAAVFVLGLGGGLMTTSNLSFMLDMTVPQAAGLYMGAWGVADFVGRAIGNIAGGLVRDLVLHWTDHMALAYGMVFALEVTGLLVALWLFRSISVQEFQHEAQARLARPLAAIGD